MSPLFPSIISDPVELHPSYLTVVESVQQVEICITITRSYRNVITIHPITVPLQGSGLCIILHE